MEDSMYEIMTIVLGIASMFVVVGAIAYFLQNKAKREGNLFTQPPSLKTKIIAFILAIVFGSLFLLEILYEDRFHTVFPILSVVLFLYSLGYSRFIKTIQKWKE
jgi:drug/metabolite transporter (DMT)-like permease